MADRSSPLLPDTRQHVWLHMVVLLLLLVVKVHLVEEETSMLV